MIGVDPHKGLHTAVAIDPAERQLGKLRVRASASQASKPLELARPRPWLSPDPAGVARWLGAVSVPCAGGVS
jgi:hypothetical protein